MDPQGQEKGLALIFNPLGEDVVREITLPLYYTGLTRRARIREREGRAKSYRLTPEGNVTLTVRIPAGGYTWYVIE